MSSLAEMMFLQQQAQPQAQGPIQRGAQAGIDAAQQTIAMSDIQRRRAQGAAMMEMAQHMFSPDYGHGFKGMMAGINAGIPHATNAYLGTEDRARQENLAMLGRQDKLEEQALRHAMQQQKMAETERYHNALISDRRARTAMKTENSSGLTKNEHNMYSKDYKFNKEALKKMSSIQKDLSVFKNETSNNAFAPFGSSLGKYPNLAKEELSKIGSAISPDKDWVKALNKEYKLKNNLFSKMKLLEPVLERASKGGQPDVSLMNRFEKLKVLFSEDQPLEVLEEKFNEIMKHVEENMLDAENVLKTGNIFADRVTAEPNTQKFGFKPINEMSPEERMSELQLIEQELNAGK